MAIRQRYFQLSIILLKILPLELQGRTVFRIQVMDMLKMISGLNIKFPLRMEIFPFYALTYIAQV